MLSPPAKTTPLVALTVAIAAAMVVVATAPAQEAQSDPPAAAESRADTTSSTDQEGEADAAPATAAGEVDRSTGDAAFDPEATSELSVLRAYVCRGIEQSEPTEAGKSFIPAPDGVLRLCCFSEIGGPARQDTVVHVWYWGEREMARVRLGIRGPRWRTWSTKQILDEWRGEWHVDIEDLAGALLSRLSFSVE